MPRRKKNIPLPKKEIIHSFDPLDEIESGEPELPERMHELAEKPSSWPKKIRGRPKESYHPMRGGKRKLHR